MDRRPAPSPWRPQVAFDTCGRRARAVRANTEYQLTPTELSMAAEGFALFRGAYLRARHANPPLPGLIPEHEARLRQRVEHVFAHGGVAAVAERLVREGVQCT